MRSAAQGRSAAKITRASGARAIGNRRLTGGAAKWQGLPQEQTDARRLKTAFTSRCEAMVFSADTGSGARGAQSSNLGVLNPMWGFKGISDGVAAHKIYFFIHEAAPGVSLSDRARASVEESVILTTIPY